MRPRPYLLITLAIEIAMAIAVAMAVAIAIEIAIVYGLKRTIYLYMGLRFARGSEATELRGLKRTIYLYSAVQTISRIKKKFEPRRVSL